jgi:hypothetical protein
MKSRKVLTVLGAGARFMTVVGDGEWEREEAEESLADFDNFNEVRERFLDEIGSFSLGFKERSRQNIPVIRPPSDRMEISLVIH